MTREEFIQKAEAYYDSKLSDMAKKMTLSYLGEYEEKNLPALFGIVLKYHPINYGVPAIATIERAHFDYVMGDEKKRIEGHTSLKVVKGFSPCRYVPSDEPPATEEEKLSIIDEVEDEGKQLPPWFAKVWKKGEEHEAS